MVTGLVVLIACLGMLAATVPVVVLRAGHALLRRGVLLGRRRALKTLERATDVVLDKTGTLTTGRLAVARVLPLGAEDAAGCLRLAASLEERSRHPIADAFRAQHAGEAGGFVDVPGKGIEADLGGRRLRIGRAHFCRELCRRPLPAAALGGDSMNTHIFLADADGWLAAFELQDELRSDALERVSFLKTRGLVVHLASGDAPRAAGAVARRLGIDHWRGGMSPEEKLQRIERLQAFGRTVVMIGDGVNDAAALARADASFAIGDRTAAADLVLTGNPLEGLCASIDVARRAMRLARKSMTWTLVGAALALAVVAALR